MKTPNGLTKFMGVIGQNISYTLSPVIHQEALDQFQINGVYLPVDLDKKDVAPFLGIAFRMGAIGFNVTKPYKELVASFFPQSKFKSVNTLVRGPHDWIPASTDGEGFVRGLSRIGVGIEQFSRLVILGSGGAAQAIVSHLVGLTQSPHIAICCRKPEALQGYAELVNPRVTLHPLNPLMVKSCLAEGDGKALLVQATSAPHLGDMLDEYIPCLTHLKGAFVDLIYDRPSSLYYAALAKDILAQDGEAMLIEQARLSQELWWGKSLTYDAVRSSMRVAKKA